MKGRKIILGVLLIMFFDFIFSTDLVKIDMEILASREIGELTGLWVVYAKELKTIYSIAEKMVELEDKFIDLSFSMGEMEGLTAEDVKKYIRYIADRRLIGLGMKGIFKVKRNPLPWVEEMVNAPTHTNFFENRSTDYSKGAMTGNWEEVWA